VAHVVAAVADFFFASKLREAARGAGAQLAFAGSAEEAVAKAAALRARLVLIDLNAAEFSGVGVVRALKADPRTRAATAVGYLSHVMTDLKAEAEAAGCDRVLARSAFVKLLPKLLAEA
jgi:CheY-like chemotaxis protein